MAAVNGVETNSSTPIESIETTQAGAQQQGASDDANAQDANTGDEVTDVDFEEVTEDEKK